MRQTRFQGSQIHQWNTLRVSGGQARWEQSSFEEKCRGKQPLYPLNLGKAIAKSKPCDAKVIVITQVASTTTRALVELYCGWCGNLCGLGVSQIEVAKESEGEVRAI